MAKLFPPILGDTIPAFYSENGIVKITIPFSMNKAVSNKQVFGFVLKIKTVQSSTYLLTIQNKDINTYNIEDSPYVTFSIDINEFNPFKIGQFYKFQIAYIDINNEIGYYSTVATGKYTTKPTLYISTANLEDGLKIGQINMNSNYYFGYYGQLDNNADITERVYSYKFDMYDSSGNLFATSGEQLHNSYNDTELYESYDNFILEKDLEIDRSYYIQYSIKTINNLELSTPKYRVMRKTSIETEMEASISATLNFENGYVDIDLIGTKNKYGLETPVTGAFLVTRSCSDNNYTVWEEISRFKLQAQNPSRWLWRDYTVEQGKTYKYAIQQYNDAGLYSNRLESNEMYVDFEHAFLYDGNRQLKIKYNPKVSSLKIDLLEAKIDTIGSQYPYIFRNGNVYYREFPISGLISYLMDEENLFIDKDDIISYEKSTDLIGENLYKERAFKTEVLEWLTNGEPKIFRSPTEGNFIVRLLNVSLTPTDQLGRMLHTFNCTAYEIADFTYSVLNEYNFIHLIDPEVSYLRFKTVNFYDTIDGKVIYKHGQINNLPAVTARIDNMTPGDILEIIKNNGDRETITIGVTGSYYIDIGTEIKAIIIPEDKDTNDNYIYNYTGSLTYSYYSISQNLFNKIDNVSVYEVPTKQFIGENDILKEIQEIKLVDETYEINPKVEILDFYWIHAQKRPVEKIVEKNGIYYTDMNYTVKLTSPDPFALYCVGTWTNTNIFSPYHKEYDFTPFYYIDFNTKQKSFNYDPFVYINDEPVDLTEIINYTIEDKFNVPKSFKIGNGAMLECAYQIREVNYLIEENKIWNTLEQKNKYLELLKEFRQWQIDCEKNESELDDLLKTNYDMWLYQINMLALKEISYRENINKQYKIYIQTLIKDQKEEAVSEQE